MSSVCVTHVQAGVVGEQAVVTQSHVLLLPLLVEGFTASFHQHALQEPEHMFEPNDQPFQFIRSDLCYWRQTGAIR